tara:strand:+ start:192 stop:593 length:402 start_codon:yes stop_codon:yes gene_type:complete
MPNTSTLIFNDGGRSHYFKGRTGDCATRAMSIALELDYKLCYDELAKAHSAKTGKRSARNGIYKDDFNTVLKLHGWVWHSAPKFDGRKARYSDMPQGRVIVRMARHFAAVVDGVLYDTWDSRYKMVYGYWAKQ